jgi:hypothetical protein
MDDFSALIDVVQAAFTKYISPNPSERAVLCLSEMLTLLKSRSIKDESIWSTDRWGANTVREIVPRLRRCVFTSKPILICDGDRVRSHGSGAPPALFPPASATSPPTRLARRGLRGGAYNIMASSSNAAASTSLSPGHPSTCDDKVNDLSRITLATEAIRTALLLLPSQRCVLPEEAVGHAFVFCLCACICAAERSQESAVAVESGAGVGRQIGHASGPGVAEGGARSVMASDALAGSVTTDSDGIAPTTTSTGASSKGTMHRKSVRENVASLVEDADAMVSLYSMKKVLACSCHTQ